WQQDDRLGFIKLIEGHLSGEDAGQFRRVIRYLKRWKDVHFSNEGRAAPTGLSLTVAAHKWFRPRRTSTEYDDLDATLGVVRAMHQSFVQTWDPSLGCYMPRISLQFPCAPWDNVFERMTNQQMQEFYQRLEALSGWLQEAQKTGLTAPLRK